MKQTKPDSIHVGDFIYCRSKYYRDQLQLPQELGLVIEIKRSNFKILYANFGLGTKWTQGDFNLDGKIDFIDFQMLEANFGKTSPTPVAGPSIAGVPEPVSLAWIGLGGVMLMARRARK